MFVTESTTVSIASTLRLMIDWKAVTMCAAQTTGSMPVCGEAAWLPLPVTRMLKIDAPAMIGPSATPSSPVGILFQTFKPTE